MAKEPTNKAGADKTASTETEKAVPGNTSSPAKSAPAAAPTAVAEGATVATETEKPVPGNTPSPVKDAPATVRTTVTEETAVAKDRSGEPVSAELRPEPVADPAFPRGALRKAYSDPSRFGGMIAKKRVLASGQEIDLGRPAGDGETRYFRARTRVLASGTLYEPGAMVPLTLTEYRTKKTYGIVGEHSFAEGPTQDELAQAG